MKKKFVFRIIVVLVLIGVLGFLVGNYFFVKKQYKDKYIEYLNKECGYLEDELLIEDVYVSLNLDLFSMEYMYLKTEERFLITINSNGEIVHQVYKNGRYQDIPEVGEYVPPIK